jgi:hypothetical protein
MTDFDKGFAERNTRGMDTKREEDMLSVDYVILGRFCVFLWTMLVFGSVQVVVAGSKDLESPMSVGVDLDSPFFVFLYSFEMLVV